MRTLRATILCLAVGQLGCQTMPGLSGRVYYAPPRGGVVQHSRERELRAAPEEAYGRSVRYAIPHLQGRSVVAARALRVVVRESGLSEDASLLAFRVLEDDLSQGEQAHLYFRLASESGRVLEWYGLARLVNSELQFDWAASY